MESKPCPFCGSHAIKYSIKATEHLGVRRYRVAMYCASCNCYGPRVLSETMDSDDYKRRKSVESNSNLLDAAIEAWNKRS